MKKILIVTDYRDLVRHDILANSPGYLPKLVHHLQEQGFDVTVRQVSEIVNSDMSKIRGYYIIYASSEFHEYKLYIDDLLFQLSKNNVLIPRYEMFRAHHNKGYQELLKKELGVHSLRAWYFGEYSECMRHADEFDYPIVFKKTEGAGSHEVALVRNKQELDRILKKKFRRKYYWWFLVKKSMKKYVFKNRYDDNYYSNSRTYGRFILQEFVPGLTEDWKILIINRNYYFINRKVPTNDFRASGVGIKSYTKSPPQEVLDYAKKIYEAFRVPYISIDIGLSNGMCYLLEYQSVHMGPVAVERSQFHFFHDGDHWEKSMKKSDLAMEFARSIADHIHG